MNFETMLNRYAELAVHVGVHLQPGQTLWVNAPIHTADLVRLITRKAYEAGAQHVHVEWQDEAVTRLKYELAPLDSLEQYPAWRVDALQTLVDQNGAYLYIDSGDPEAFKGVDSNRIGTFSKAAGKALTSWRKAMTSDQITWSIMAAPSAEWAKLVFPGQDPDQAVRLLWEAIFRAARADKPDPVQAWREHNAQLETKLQYLNAKQYKKLHYIAEGTNLTVALPEHHIWKGGHTRNRLGNTFNPNLPTEEVFISPHRAGTSGVVRSSKPLSYQGNLINHFSLTFENGKVIDFEAETGYDTLKTMLDMDEGARYLGEVALVPHESPISQSDIIFFNTLFDENASNHLALGKAFANCIEHGNDMTPEQQRQAGLNDSFIHVDFMIGTAEMDIDGELADGTLEPVFRSGTWAT
ncbi:aminopeptidase [Paenibacillus gansuensis]|uniref:Aminopeptidase n=1 Tax=Paenibacillus gansuensis TaxID=306542 RepID=A0ABW5PCZ4_9BACL